MPSDPCSILRPEHLSKLGSLGRSRDPIDEGSSFRPLHTLPFINQPPQLFRVRFHGRQLCSMKIDGTSSSSVGRKFSPHTPSPNRTFIWIDLPIALLLVSHGAYFWARCLSSLVLGGGGFAFTSHEGATGNNSIWESLSASGGICSFSWMKWGTVLPTACWLGLLIHQALSKKPWYGLMARAWIITTLRLFRTVPAALGLLLGLKCPPEIAHLVSPALADKYALNLAIFSACGVVRFKP